MSDTIDVPYDAGDAKQVAERGRKTRREQAEHDTMLKGIMESTPGRRWIWRLLTKCNVFSTSFHENSRVTAFLEGKRDIGLNIIADIMRICPDEYVRMAGENTEKVK
jgi:hypothetical protein